MGNYDILSQNWLSYNYKEKKPKLAEKVKIDIFSHSYDLKSDNYEIKSSKYDTKSQNYDCRKQNANCDKSHNYGIG